jgi:cell division protein FtsI/penicillin-binding protein 2
MVGAVESPSGTGHAAAIPGVEVAGKTGTAELQSATQCQAPGASCSASEREAAQSRENTDAWFAAFAPAGHPEVTVAVLLVKDGFGGETAAPVAREVIEAALRAGV